MRTISLFFSALLFAGYAAAQSYKCQGVDGKIEYSDRPCADGKQVLTDPTKKGASFKPLIAPMERLKTLFTDYEERLCEREKLATEIDVANRSGAMKAAPDDWKAKQEHLSQLNDTQIEFQDKASKITQSEGPESEVSKELRRFRTKLRDCGKLPELPPAPPKSAKPVPAKK